MPNEKLYSDFFSGVLNDVAHAGEALRADIEGFVKARLEKLLGEMNLVSREEFEAVKAMAGQARLENERLEARIKALEERPTP
jgi:BMFP domain-containing protein YqiC